MAKTHLQGKPGHSNVVPLPGAAPRMIRNPVRAAREYRREQPAWPGGRTMVPGEADAKALTARRSPELLIALCILKALPSEQRRAAQDAVHRIAFLADDEVSQLASILVAQMKEA